MIQGGGDPVPGMDPSSFENRQSMSVNQGHPSGSWSSASGQASVSWNFHQTSNGHGQGQGQGQGHIESTAPYYYDQPTQSSAPTGTSEGAQAQGYGGYYYNGYQHQNSDPSFQQVGASQNTGAPYQPLSSFPNPGPSYSATYYNAGDHQTGVWNASNYGTYNQGHNYPSYNPTETKTAAPASSIPYQQQYDPWANYYSSATPVVSCPPGTENAAVPTVSVGQPFPVQGASGGYQYPSNQPPPPGTTSWRRDSASSGLPSLQVMKDIAPPNESGGWEVGGQGFQNPQTYPLPSYFQKPPDSNPPPHENYQSQQKNIYSQGLSLQLSSTNQVSENLQPPLQTAMTLDTRRVSKVQIPTNPRIAPSSVLGMPKIEKEISMVSPAMKPVYTSVSVPKLNNETPSHTDAEAMAKPTELPPSLTGYAQRTFARCKDDAERSVNQNIMFEMMRKASDDGTLFTINWDIEPLFPLPNANPGIATQSTLQSSITVSSLPKFKRSPSRRTKSRWEPIAEEKLVERLASANNAHLKGSDKGADTRKYENRDNGWSGLKFLSPQQQTPTSKIGQRPMKKPRFENDGSSDSDKEQGLTKYYASAIALADTPEERKRREHRSKRFEKVKENQAETKHPRLKISGAGNVYIRRANAMVLAKNSEDGFNRAVEDIDWDSLTVKGTCLEIEKRYLRLTTAPDPTTVRPEEILEKALQMVQTSQKNYLYKCDQLKSIRQDLTVQRIQNELTVKVYETHARFALEAGDLPEYNQCQSQLTRLYAEGIKGSHMEFSAYNLLCVILHSDNKRDLVSSMARLSNQAKDDEAVKHALAVRSAVSSGNYILFFRLYKAAPNLSTYLMDLYVEKMRFEAVKCMSKSYRPTVPVKYIARVLGFSRAAPDEGGQTKGGESLEECKEWLQSHGAVLLTDEGSGELQMDGKASSSSLYMPEPEDAVAHGDASLGVDDFLTRASS